MVLHARRRRLQHRLRRQAESALPPRHHHLLAVLAGVHQRPVSFPVRRHRRQRRLCLDRSHHPRPVVGRRHHAQRPPLCFRRHDHHHAAAHDAPLRLRQVSRLPLVLLDHRRHPDLAGVYHRHQRLHAGVGQAGAVRHRRHRRTARLDPDLQGRGDPQLHLRRPRQRPPVHPACLRPPRRAAAGADGDVDPRPAGAARPHQSAQGNRHLGHCHLPRPVARQAGGEPGPCQPASTGSTCRSTRSSTSGRSPPSGDS